MWCDAEAAGTDQPSKFAVAGLLDHPKLFQITAQIGEYGRISMCVDD